MRKNLHLALVSTAILAAASAMGCSFGGSSDSDDVSSQVQNLVARPSARLFLTDSVVQRLQARAASGDAAWGALKKACDDYATGTMHKPSGTDYPGYPNVGEGFQGDEYLPVVRALGLCYRTVRGVDGVAEARYGEAGSRLLEAMSEPPASGGLPPSTNSGYGIRHYGVGMALGFDWLYPALSSSLRARLITSMNSWVDWYDSSGFVRNDPIANYFTGYLLAKTTTALATEGDNPKAAAYWDDVQNRLWSELVKPQFSSMMEGGGWPEGWGYGKKAVLSVAETMWAAKTAKNLDWWNELPQLRDQAMYVTYFAWPSLKHMDDQGTIRSGIDLKASVELSSGLATMLEAKGDAFAGVARAFANDAAATAGDDRDEWSKFLYGDPAASVGSYTTQALSYFAPGPDHVAVRSSWNKDATWAQISGGAYINASDSGEQLYGSGSFSVVRGDQPILVNATGWLPQTAGTEGENFVYNDTYQARQRQLYNTFFVDDATNIYNPGQNNFGPGDSQAHIERFEDTGAFVRARAANIEDQYGWHDGSRPVTQFTRDFVFARPGTVVIFDRTTVANGSADQWVAFHTPSAPSQTSTSDSTQRRLDVSGGSIRTLLPRGAAIETTALPGGTTRIEAHAPVRQAEQQWLSVVTADASVPEQTRLSAADGNVTTGNLVGVHVQTARQQVVLFAADQAVTAQVSSAEYSVAQTGEADHLLVDVAPSSTGYSVTASQAGGKLVVRVSAGGSLRASQAGTLSFSVSASGQVSAAVPPAVAPVTEPGAAPPATPPTTPAGDTGSAGGSDAPPAGAGSTPGSGESVPEQVVTNPIDAAVDTAGNAPGTATTDTDTVADGVDAELAPTAGVNQGSMLESAGRQVLAAPQIDPSAAIEAIHNR
jgi:hypothetical protein